MSVTGVSYQRLVLANHLPRGAWHLFTVRSLEVVRITGVKCMHIMWRSAGGTWFVRCAEVVHFSECPLCYERCGTNFTLSMQNANQNSTKALKDGHPHTNTQVGEQTFVWMGLVHIYTLSVPRTKHTICFIFTV